MDDAAESARGARPEPDSGRHSVLCNDDGQYAIWPGAVTVPGGWQPVFGPAPRAECRDFVARVWTGPGGASAGAGFADTVHGLFRARAAHDPQALAVLAEGGGQERTGRDGTGGGGAGSAGTGTGSGGYGELTYRELDERSDGLAAVLRAAGVGPDRVVPVCLERRADLAVAWLAVLKAGGAFLPLDPAHPDRRLARLVEDCGASLVVTCPAAAHRFPTTVPVTEGAGLPAPPDLAGPDDLAYLIYTSGTTGTPKGVPVTHRALVFTLSRVIEAYGLTPRDRVLQLAALGFDTSLEQVFATLLSGATLVLGGGRTWAPTELLHRMPALGLTVADLTPAYWHHVLALLPEGGPPPEGLRLLIVGGDTVHADDCRRCLERLPGVRLVNAYGVTEAAVTSTLCEVTAPLLRTPGAPVPIGKPLPGVRVHVLDRRLCPVRPGEKGEIYLGGPGLARGYWRQPVLTAESFLPDPYAAVPGERMYRTGDAGRWRADGNLELLGRFDDQVKVRGFRVDPAEIEAVLAAHPDVRLARVAADARLAPDGSEDGERVLTAYYTLAERPGKEGGGGAGGEIGTEGATGTKSAADAARGARARRSGIRDYLAERLPDFMVPGEFVLLDSMPLTAAGKIDRRRLAGAEPRLQRRGTPNGAEGRGPEPALTAPAPPADVNGGGDGDAVENVVAHLWSELLRIEEVGPGDDFFDLGGDSLLAMEMLARARIMFGIDVTRIRFLTRSLLRDATLRAFAATVRSARSDLPRDLGGAAVDWQAEAQLSTPIRLSWRPAPSRAEPAEILLTGATGFCGAHLLHTLLRTTRARIHCLVRAPDEEHALERIRAAQQRFLRHDLADARVVPLVGDLTAPLLGLPQRRFEELADSLDAVHHLGGQVNFIYPYHQLRAANVGGTREVVRLAGHSRGIPVHYLSSLAVLAGFGPAGIGEVTERTPLAHAERLAVGYVESKWVAEQLLHNAAAAGLPVTVLRTNDVTGDLAGGVMNTGTEICALIKYIAESGSCPDVRLLLDFVPADRFSQAVAHIAAHAPAAGEVYHVTSPRPALLADLAERLREFGYPVTELPYQEWVRGLVRFAARHPTHPMTPFVPLFVDRSPGSQLSISELYFRPTFPLFDRANTERALVGSGVDLPAVDGALLDLYIGQLVESGFVAAPVAAREVREVRR